MISKIIQLILALVLIIIGPCTGENLKNELIGAGLILLISLFFNALEEVIRNFKRLKLFWQIFLLRLKRQKIRFSMAYLYLIKVEGEYLLVRNSNFGHYQLVGGKYKMLEGTKQLLKNDFEASGDLQLPEKPLMKKDFALFIPAKKAISFLDWFNKGKDREISHWREFYEELIEGKASILSKNNFPYINYNHIKTIRTPVKKSKGWDCYEILQYDILEIEPNNTQLEELKLIKAKGDTDYIKWADIELIQSLGYDKRTRKVLYNIGEHTKWAVNQKWSKEEM